MASEISICRSCRLIYENHRRYCMDCGQSEIIPLKAIVEKRSSKGFRKITPRKRGLRYFDIIFFLLVFILPLEAERYHLDSIWVLVSTFILWFAFRLIHYIWTHYQFGEISTQNHLEGIRFEHIFENCSKKNDSCLEGKVFRYQSSIKSPLSKKSCIAYSIELIREINSEALLYLRRQEQVAFLFQSKNEEIMIDGVYRLRDISLQKFSIENDEKALNTKLDTIWCKESYLVEKILQHQKRIRLIGGVEDRITIKDKKGQKKNLKRIQGIRSNPIFIEIIR